MGSECGSEGIVVYEGKQDGVGTALGQFQQEELSLGWQFLCLAAPLGGHPPQFAPRACQEPLAVELQGTMLVWTSIQSLKV
jgi:hypothetical protein